MSMRWSGFLIHKYVHTTEIVYDNKNLHITELEDTAGVYFILFYLLVIKDNDPAVKIWPGRVRGNRQSFSHGPIVVILFVGISPNTQLYREGQFYW
jgi:hypothetical protein